MILKWNNGQKTHLSFEKRTLKIRRSVYRHPTQLLYTMKPWSHRIDDGRQNSFNGRMNLINLAHVNNYLKQIT